LVERTCLLTCELEDGVRSRVLAIKVLHHPTSAHEIGTLPTCFDVNCALELKLFRIE
jgi:hypothetical protein